MSMNPHELSNGAKHLIDGISVVTVLGTLMQVLPALAALLTVIWTGIRIYETETVKSMIAWFRGR